MRRAFFRFTPGQAFPVSLLPDSTSSRPFPNRLFLLFLFQGCDCGTLIDAVGRLAARAPESRYIVCIEEQWLAEQDRPFKLAACPDLFEEMAIHATPYAVRIDGQTLADGAIVNWPDHPWAYTNVAC